MNESVINLNQNGLLFLLVCGCIVLLIVSIFAGRTVHVTHLPRIKMVRLFLLWTILIFGLIFLYANWRTLFTVAEKKVQDTEERIGEKIRRNSRRHAVRYEEREANDERDSEYSHSRKTRRNGNSATLGHASSRESSAEDYAERNEEERRSQSRIVGIERQTISINVFGGGQDITLKTNSGSAIHITTAQPEHSEPKKECEPPVEQKAVQSSPPVTSSVQQTPAMDVETRARKALEQQERLGNTIEACISTNISVSESSFDFGRMIEGVKKTFSSSLEKEKHADIRTYEYHILVVIPSNVPYDQKIQIKSDLKKLLNEFVADKQQALRDDYDYSVPQNKVKQAKFAALFDEFLNQSPENSRKRHDRTDWIHWLAENPINMIKKVWFTYPGMDRSLIPGLENQKEK